MWLRTPRISRCISLPIPGFLCISRTAEKVLIQRKRLWWKPYTFLNWQQSGSEPWYSWCYFDTGFVFYVAGEILDWCTGSKVILLDWPFLASGRVIALFLHQQRIHVMLSQHSSSGISSFYGKAMMIDGGGGDEGDDHNGCTSTFTG